MSKKKTGLGGGKQRMMGDLKSALTASLDLRAVLKEAYGLLLPLVGADYGALATSPSEDAGEYQWIDQNLPPAFLRSYAEMAPHDFVLRAVQTKIGRVLRDSEMIDRTALERNLMYHRAREVGVRLEHVMAVMLHVGDGWQSGLSLYRDRRRPFTEREQRLLQELTTDLANTVRNCLLYAKEKRRGRLFETLLDSNETAVVVVRSPAQEIDRTSSATALLDAWFEPIERGSGRLPQVLLDQLAEAQAARVQGNGRPWSWRRDGGTAFLRVEFVPLPEPVGAPVWALKLHEVSRDLPLPAAWGDALTKREREVFSKMILGWDNRLIAGALNCAPNTVKKHVERIFAALAVEDRTTLVVRYHELMRDT
jgi:DNA-binding CsgD family transcriptional regulator/GAF domain-containing protein